MHLLKHVNLAGIHPSTPSGLVSSKQWIKLVESVRKILQEAIVKGGTTLRDFVNSEGKPGYFSQELHVYGRAGLPCLRCENALQKIILGQRSTVFCTHCQSLPIDPLYRL